jgi:hypothetical protein
MYVVIRTEAYRLGLTVHNNSNFQIKLHLGYFKAVNEMLLSVEE